MVGHTYIKDVGQYVGQEVELRGWLYNKRSSGKIQFLLVRDRTALFKGYAQNEVTPEVFEAAKGSPKNPLLGCGEWCEQMNGLPAATNSPLPT